MAAVINKRDVALQAASPRVIAVNLGTTVNVNGTLNGTPVATVVTNAAAGATHAGLSGNPHNVSLTQIAGDLDDISNGSTYFKTTVNQVTGAGRAYNALDSSNEYIKSLTSTKMTLVGSNPSTGWVGDGNGIRMYQGGVLKVNIPVSGAPSFSGDITGGSNINITGQGVFGGSVSSDSTTWAIVGNNASASTGGVIGWAGSAGAGIRGNCVSSLSSSRGVEGLAAAGTGVYGVASTGVGVKAQITGSGTALQVLGKMTINDSTLVSNLNADMLDGYHAASLCNIVTTNSGTCTVSGSGFQNLVTGSLGSTVRTRGTGNIVYIENISDRRLKTDIEDEILGLDFINSLRPRSFRMRSNPKLLAHGLIYQEVEKLLDDHPDALACLNDDSTGSVDYNGIVSPIIKAIQELSYKFNMLSEERNGKNS